MFSDTGRRDRWRRLDAKAAGALCTVVGASLLGAWSCGGSDLSCGDGTRESDGKCVVAAANDGGSGGAAGSSGGTGAGGMADTPDASAPPTGGAGGVPTSTPVDSGLVPETFEFGGVVSAAPASDQSIVVSWLPASYPKRPLAVIEYGVYAATTTGAQNFSEPTAVAPPGATSLLLEGLSAGEELFFVVRAMSDDGPAEDDNVIEYAATPENDSTAPTFAGATGAEPAGPAAVRVTWDAATDDLTPQTGIGYHVLWSDLQGRARKGDLGAVSLPGATSAVVTGLPAPESTFYFFVESVDAAGNSDNNTVEVSGQTGPDDVAPIFGGCSALASEKANGVTVAWEPAVDDTTPANQMTYNVYAFSVPVDADTTFAEPVATFTGGTSGAVQTLNEATTYRVVCRAADEFGNEDDNRLVRTFSTLNDGSPPVFNGLETLSVGSITADLSWAAATDDQTDPEDIVYEVYISTETGGYDFGAPFAESLPGATAMTVFDIPSNTELFFLIRAKDEANNRDANTAEQSGTSLVSFEKDVQAILTANCAVTTCHVPPAPPQGQNLAEGAAYINVVDVVAREAATLPSPGDQQLKRVDSSSTDPTRSYLFRKITSDTSGMTGDAGPFTPNGAITGSSMPPPDSGRFISPEQVEIIRRWITQGSQNN